jgi:hypothetical protein
MRHENIACVIAGPRQSSSRRDRQNGHPDCRCVPIQIVALQRRKFDDLIKAPDGTRINIPRRALVVERSF